MMKSSWSTIHPVKQAFGDAASFLNVHADGIVKPFLLTLIALTAFLLRLFSVVRYESVIHEFDPWFNYRASEYLVKHGWRAFLNWFDEEAWYPLGRAVGVTVYPGMLLTAWLAHTALNTLLAFPTDLKTVCVFMAPVFSGLTSLAAYKLTSLVKDDLAGLLAAGFIAIVPGYISRSVAGSYDYEGIAITIMLCTFYTWCRSLRPDVSAVRWGMVTAGLYYYMVSSWGGYVFVTNLIPLHALSLVLTGRYNGRLYTTFCIWYVFGTLANLTIPFVAFQPVSTSEHMAAMGMFCLLQVFAFVDCVKGYIGQQHHHAAVRVLLAGMMGAVGAAFGGLAWAGKIAPFAGRFYSLWDTSYARKHIPIIASVSEHQPTTWGSFFFDLQGLLILLPVGLHWCVQQLAPEHLFVLLYSITSVYFAGVMVRLILTLTPVVCIAAGVGLSAVLDAQAAHRDKVSRAVVGAAALLVLAQFVMHCTWVTSNAYSSPSIIMSSTDPRTGQQRIIDDFREAYAWLRFNTPRDSKVLAWWDYGYQMAGMADRTTIVDNNTWNNTHIATVGRILASSEDDAYPMLRELDVDYVLVLFGGLSGFSGDDLNKFLWMIRIAQGVYPEHVREVDFFNAQGEYRTDQRGSPVLRSSLLYKLSFYRYAHLHPQRQPVDRARGYPVPGIDPTLWTVKEAYSTENMIMRIYRVNRLDGLGRSQKLASK